MFFLIYLLLTSSDFIRWQSSTSRLVPSILIVTDSFSFSSNLTVAAEWNTTLTVRHSKFCKSKDGYLNCSDV